MATNAPARASIAKRPVPRHVVATNGGPPTPDALKELLRALTAARGGDAMVERRCSYADEVARVDREVGTEGKHGGQAKVKGGSGTWKDLSDPVNVRAGNLTSQVRNIAQVTTAVARGDLYQKITDDV